MKKVSVLILVLVLGACVGTSRQSKFYSLAVENAGVITAPYKNGLSVGVKEVKVPSYVDKPQMVTQNKTAVELRTQSLERAVGNNAAADDCRGYGSGFAACCRKGTDVGQRKV